MKLTVEHKKYITIAVVVGLVGTVVYLINKASKDGYNDNNNVLDPTGNGTTSPAVGVKFNAKSIAEDLYNAMKGTGTDEAMITDVLTRVNPTQFEQVFHAFGKRGYNKNFGNVSFFIWETIVKYDLKFWLKNELNDSDYRILKLKYPQYL